MDGLRKGLGVKTEIYKVIKNVNDTVNQKNLERGELTSNKRSYFKWQATNLRNKNGNVM